MTAIDGIQLQKIVSKREPLSSAEIQRRIELHTDDSIVVLKSINTGTETIRLPQITGEQDVSLDAVFQAASKDDQEKLVSAANAIVSHAYAAISASNESGTAVNPSEVADVAESDIAIAAEIIEGYGPKQVDELTADVIALAADAANQDLHQLAIEMSEVLQSKSNKREEVAEFQDTLADMKDGDSAEFTWTEKDANGNMVEHTEVLTKKKAEAKLSMLDMQLSTLGDLTQEYQFRMQQAQELQSQTMNILSAILKDFHDVAKSIIQNVRA